MNEKIYSIIKQRILSLHYEPGQKKTCRRTGRQPNTDSGNFFEVGVGKARHYHAEGRHHGNQD